MPADGLPGRRGDSRPHWSIEDVLARTDLAALLDRVAEPATQSLRGRKWHCPIQDHDDSHASVTMHVDHRGHERWRCWSGDDAHRGDAIDLAMATQHLDRREALDWLASRAGMTPDRPPPPITRKPFVAARPRLVDLDPAVTQYAQACERILWTRTGLPVREWLHGRGFSNDVLRSNHVGADPGRRLPRARGLPYGASIAAVFPALGPEGDIRYLQARYLHPGDGPKYDNPASSLGTNPRLAWTNPVGPVRPGVLIICEGIPDALTAAQAGFHATALLGANAVDDTVIERLTCHVERTRDRLVAIPDNDTAGMSSGERLRDLLESRGQSLTVITPSTSGADLCQWSADNPAWTAEVTNKLDTGLDSSSLTEPRSAAFE